MGEWNFNTAECVRALIKLGFYLKNKRRGDHDKYAVPEVYKRNLPQYHRGFLMVPRHSELRLQQQIVKELEVIGGKGLVEKFRNCL